MSDIATSVIERLPNEGARAYAARVLLIFKQWHLDIPLLFNRAMASGAKGDQITWIVSIVRVRKASNRYFVMNIKCAWQFALWSAAALAFIASAFTRFFASRIPIGAIIRFPAAEHADARAGDRARADQRHDLAERRAAVCGRCRERWEAGAAAVEVPAGGARATCGGGSAAAGDAGSGAAAVMDLPPADAARDIAKRPAG